MRVYVVSVVCVRVFSSVFVMCGVCGVVWCVLCFVLLCVFLDRVLCYACSGLMI